MGIDRGFRIGLLVADQVVVELKCVDQIQPIHHAQIISCLKLTGCEVGLLLNFHVEHMRDGIERFVQSVKA